MTRYLLQHHTSGMRLRDRFSHQHPLVIDFLDRRFSYRLKRGGGSRELLAKAVGVKPGLNVVDCTAGLGRDSFLLASLGCKVTMVERSPVVCLLLEDAIARALANGETADIARRLSLIGGDALHILPSLEQVPDAVLVDPMFPERKKAARAKGDMQILQRFLGEDTDVEDLLECALDSGSKRVVVKRPRAGRIEGWEPSYSLKGSSSRFDVFIRPDPVP